MGGLARLVGDSPALARAKAILSRVAPRDATVLLRGETGTGKELAARAVHDLSPRASGPFVRVHCAALPDTLLESELFGHEAGAFTGAVRKKPGRVELAEGGTLFLDEIGDASPVVQVKLLHLLQEGEYCPLGSTAHKRADVRFVAATHRDLEAMVAEGTFREDLFYRLHVLPVTLPPLRARVGDVPLLVRALAEDLLSSGGSAARGFSEAALERLGAEAWPGNVRQLKNVVDRLLILAEGDEVTLDEVETELGDAPPHRSAALGEASLRAQRRAVEQNAVERALREAGGNRSQAARLLGISRRTLYKKLGPQAAEK